MTTRPTADRVREALFNRLAHAAIAEVELAGATVLDCFCGAGALGLEALSQGAASAAFIDNDRRAIAAARGNAAGLGETETCRFIQADCLTPPAGRPVDIVFLDPPYGAGLAAAALPALGSAGWLGPRTLIVVEADASRPEVPPEGFAEIDRRTYGRTLSQFWRPVGP